MEFSYSKNKNFTNIQKHGISLADAKLLDWNSLLFIEDERQNYGEVRLIGFAPLGSRLYCIVYTERNEVVHVISLRKANTREVNRYVIARQKTKS